jgi:hypothetical protein
LTTLSWVAVALSVTVLVGLWGGLIGFVLRLGKQR